MRFKALLISQFMFCAAVFAKGNEGGGGGNVCKIGNTVKLLELAELPPVASEPGVQIRTSKIATQLGLDKVNLVEGRLKESVESVLNSWSQVHPLLTGELKRAIYSIKFYSTPFIPKKSAAASFTGLRHCNEKNTRASIIYQNFGAVISTPLFNALDLDSQTATILHEGARVLAHQYKILKNEARPSTADLQQLTLAMMRANPKGTLYDLPFLKKIQIFGWQPTFASYCAGLKDWPAIKNQPADVVEDQLNKCVTGYSTIEAEIDRHIQKYDSVMDQGGTPENVDDQLIEFAKTMARFYETDKSGNAADQYKSIAVSTSANIFHTSFIGLLVSHYGARIKMIFGNIEAENKIGLLIEMCKAWTDYMDQENPPDAPPGYTKEKAFNEYIKWVTNLKKQVQASVENTTILSKMIKYSEQKN